MSDVFISYSRADRPRAEALFEVLSAQGWSVWWDKELLAGDLYDDVIDDQLRRSRCVLVLWSEASIGSRWVRAEAAEGLERGVLVPVQLDPVRLPLEFRRLQTVSLVAGLDDPSGLADLVAGVRRLVGEGSVPEEDAVVRIDCPSCGTSNKAPARMAGRKGKCRQCGEAIVVPGTPPAGDTPQRVEPTPLAAGRAPAEAKRRAPSARRPSRGVLLGVSAFVLVVAGLGAAAGGLFDGGPRDEVPSSADGRDDALAQDGSAPDEQADRQDEANRQEAPGAETAQQAVAKQKADAERARSAREAQQKSARIQAANDLEDARQALDAGDLVEAQRALTAVEQALSDGVDRDDVDPSELSERLKDVRAAREHGAELLAGVAGEQHLRSLCEALNDLERFRREQPEAAVGLAIDAALPEAQLRHEQLLKQIAGRSEGFAFDAGRAPDPDELFEVLVEVDTSLDALPEPSACKHARKDVQDARESMQGVLATVRKTFERLTRDVPADAPWRTSLAEMDALAGVRRKLTSQRGQQLAADLSRQLAERLEAALRGESTEQVRALGLVALTELLDREGSAAEERLVGVASELLASFEQSFDDAASATARLEQLETLFPAGLAGVWDERLDVLRAHCRDVVEALSARLVSLALDAGRALEDGDVEAARSLYRSLRQESDANSRYWVIARLGLVECDGHDLPTHRDQNQLADFERLIKAYGEVERLGVFTDLDQVSIPALCAFRAFELHDEILEVHFDLYERDTSNNRLIKNVNKAREEKVDAFEHLDTKYGKAKDRDGRLFVDKARVL